MVHTSCRQQAQLESVQKQVFARTSNPPLWRYITPREKQWLVDTTRFGGLDLGRGGLHEGATSVFVKGDEMHQVAADAVPS